VVLPPPPDPSIERAMSPALARALEAYIALERRVQELASGGCAHVCAACRAPCCEAAFCSESWEAPWLAAAIARGGSRRPVPDGARVVEGHLASDGCTLRFGRPPVCYEFACADVIATLPSHDLRYLYRAISHVITFAGEDALPGTHLVEVADLAKIDGARARRLGRRIARAGRLLDAAVRLYRAGGRGETRDWALVKRCISPKGFQLRHGEESGAAVAASGSRAAGLRSLPVVRS